jgi:[calcium/calmodulin-dependent protein kinase] kinase
MAYRTKAVKEFSKSRLRRRIKSNFFRRPLSARHPGQLAAGRGFTPIHKQPEECGSLHLIKEEIAIMKKLNHPNLVRLVEVLDDPEEDSLYMVLELCQKGVVMKVGVGDRADPYDSETCRYWFRDMILGIEYLHAQGIAHRDIKPDNLLITSDDVLKVSDFGVSEMFEKDPDMMTAKSAGSPAFLPPELCVVRHGDVSGRAADIWSMGVSLYCLRFGRIPFEHNGVLEMYEAIKNEDVDCTPADDPKFCDLMHRILEKDPSKRITMTELRVSAVIR